MELNMEDIFIGPNEKEKYINPFTDYGFKRLFGEEINKDLLMDFLNELLRDEVGTITELTYLKNEMLGSKIIDRGAIFDIYCKNEKGESFIVELQKAKQDFFKDRTVFYSTFPIREQAQKGNWNYKLNAVFTVGILDLQLAFTIVSAVAIFSSFPFFRYASNFCSPSTSSNVHFTLTFPVLFVFNTVLVFPVRLSRFTG